MKIAIGGDSAGVSLVDILVPHLKSLKDVEVTDLSKSPSGGSEYYANMAERVAQAVLSGEADRGILCCGTGIGVAMSANKVPGIRAAQTHDTFSAERAAKSNNAHIITMGARVIGPELAKAIVNTWLASISGFDPQGPSAGNVTAIDELDKKYHK
ncbi:D-erythrulose-4-phosphate isomerase [Propionivibrio sp.]|jgi:ribose 5-phosphate isomerase B|uniref:D-erythrulose-4-phosphate isomerase n=1 Tax=Propionivibrio sp. TaxID=2212460 RepID=UPI00272E954E|nr:RpiB/LacA/LacB family sugar-phosphate isomerase [Propionivibrio sp.]